MGTWVPGFEGRFRPSKLLLKHVSVTVFETASEANDDRGQTDEQMSPPLGPATHRPLRGGATSSERLTLIATR